MTRFTRSRRGYAMALMLVVMLVITTITVTVISTATRDQESSRSASARAEARLLASYALEEFAARLVDDPTMPMEFTHPALRSTAFDELWYPLPSEDGSTVDPSLCTALQADCYYLTISDRLPAGGAPVSFKVTATVRVRCGGNESRCIYASFQQRLRATQFYDFLLSSEYSTLAPQAFLSPGASPDDWPDFASYQQTCTVRGATRQDVRSLFTSPQGSTITGCVDMAYLAARDASDVLVGPLYTADDYLTTCADPDLGDVFVSGPGHPHGEQRRFYRIASGTTCLVGSPSAESSMLNAPSLVQPGSEYVIDQALAGQDIIELRKADPQTPVEIRFDVDEVTISGSESDGTFDYDGKIIVVLGNDDQDDDWSRVDARMGGTVDGVVSVVVDGSAVIDDDLVYASSASCPSTLSAVQLSQCLNNSSDPGKGDVLSLTATDRVEIWQYCDPNPENSCLPGSPETRQVHALITSPQGYVGVPDWQDNIDGDRGQSHLVFYGSMATKFQGVFGSYASAGQTVLLSGYAKTFVHDERPTRFSRGETDAALPSLPPYVVSARIPVWTRLDLTEVPYVPTR